MEWNYQPALLVALAIGGITLSVLFGEWLEEHTKIDGLSGSMAAVALILGFVLGFVVPA